MKGFIITIAMIFTLSCMSLLACAEDDTTEHITIVVQPTVDGGGVAYTRTGLVADGTTTDTKEITVEQSLSNVNMIDISAFADGIDYDQDGYVGVLLRNDTSFSVWSSGTKEVSNTVTATKNYSNLPQNDISQIDKTYNELTLTHVDWYDQDTGASIEEYSDGQPQVYSAIAHYSGIKTDTVSTGYTASVSYTGTVTKEVIAEREVGTTDTGKTHGDTEITEPETSAADDAKDTAPAMPMLPIIAIPVLGTAGLVELIHLIIRKNKKS